MTSLSDPGLSVSLFLYLRPSLGASVSLCLCFLSCARAHTHTHTGEGAVSTANAKMSPKKQVQKLALPTTPKLVEKPAAGSSPLLPYKVHQGLGAGVCIWPGDATGKAVLLPSPFQDPVAIRNPFSPSGASMTASPERGMPVSGFLGFPPPGGQSGKAPKAAEGEGEAGRRPEEPSP